MDFDILFTLSTTLYRFIAGLWYVRALCGFIANLLFIRILCTLCCRYSTRNVNKTFPQEATNRTKISDETPENLELLLQNANLQIDRLRQEKQLLESEKQDALNILSKLMSSKLRDNNPNIADLSDNFRPTKLGELLNELYDNQWTDAFSALERHYDEKKGITFLLNIIMKAYVFCERELTESWSYVQKHYLTEDDTVTGKSLKDARKKKVLHHISETELKFTTHLSRYNKEYPSFANNDAIQEYIRECIRLCLLMNANDPPVIIECPGWQSRMWTQDQTQTEVTIYNQAPEQADEGMGTDVKPTCRQDFDRAVFKDYTSRGPYVEYIVWPITYLHRNGPMLAKGIAQGNNMKNSPPTNTELPFIIPLH